MPDRLKLFIPLIVFACIAAVFLVLQHRRTTGDYDPSALPSALIGKPIPASSLSTLEDANAVVDLQQAFREKPFILNVWATWCISCRAEHEYLNQLDRAGINVVGLNYKDERPEAKRWLENLGDPYTVVLVDGEGEYGLELGVYGAPETYIVDREGIVRYRHVGVLNQRAWEKFVLPLGISW